MNYRTISKSNYQGKILVKEFNTELQFYTKRQMKSLYPTSNFTVVGEIGNNTGVQCASLITLHGDPFPVYKVSTHNKLKESVVGYAAVDDHAFLAVVQNIFLKRVLISASIITIIITGVVIIENSVS